MIIKQITMIARSYLLVLSIALPLYAADHPKALNLLSEAGQSFADVSQNLPPEQCELLEQNPMLAMGLFTFIAQGQAIKATPLGQLLDAINADDLEAITAALSKGANVTTNIFWCGTPLAIAKRKGKSAQCIQLLEGKAARINLIRTTLYWSPQNHHEFVWYSNKNVLATVKTVLLSIRRGTKGTQEQSPNSLVVILPNEIGLHILGYLRDIDFPEPANKTADPCTIL